MAIEEELVSPAGRKIGFQELDPGEMMDVIEAADEASGNRTWLNYAIAVSSVRTIDGHPVQFPKTKIDVRALANRLGMDGVNFVLRHSYGIVDAKPAADGAAPAVDPVVAAQDAVVAAAKN